MATGRLTEQLLKTRLQLREEAHNLEFSMIEQLWADQKKLRSNVEAIVRCLQKGGLLSDPDLNLEKCESQTTSAQSDGSVEDPSDSIPAEKPVQEDACDLQCAPAHESLRTMLAAQAVAVNLNVSATKKSICSLREACRSFRHSIDASQDQRLCVIGGVDRAWVRCSQDLLNSESLDPQSGAWGSLEDHGVAGNQRTRHWNHSGAVLCGRVFVCGGGFAPFNTVKSFSFQDKTWKKMRPMRASRNHSAATAIGQHLYVTGGTDGKKVLSSCERFSPFKGEDGLGEWEDLPSMSSQRCAHAAVALRGKCFVSGGFRGDFVGMARSDVVKSAEAFNPLTGRWEELPSMPEPRYFHSAAALQGIAYICGGSGGMGAPLWTPDTSVYCYDPTTRIWSPGPQMLFPRQAHEATVLAGRIYVCGGFVEPAPEMNHIHAGHSVECFNLETGTWESAEPMKEGRAQFSLAVVSQLQQAAPF